MPQRVKFIFSRLVGSKQEQCELDVYDSIRIHRGNTLIKRGPNAVSIMQKRSFNSEAGSLRRTDHLSH